MDPKNHPVDNIAQNLMSPQHQIPEHPPDKSDNSANTKKMSGLAKKYKKHTHRQHILELPDTYIGSIDPVTEPVWYYDPKSPEEGKSDKSEQQQQQQQSLGLGSQMVCEDLTIVPGLYKIFDEILVNARDHVVRLHAKRIADRDTKISPVTTIRVSIDSSSGLVTVWNDGDGIDVEQHPEHEVYIPSLVFGELLTSTNYDKSEKRVTGGKNGYGAKLTNIFSKYFAIETVDSYRKRSFRQEFRNNLTVKDTPKVKNLKGKPKPYTKIEFIPDFPKFGMEGWTPDMLRVMTRRVMDIAACTDKSVKVYLDDNLLPCRDFQQYMAHYLGSPEDQFRMFERVNDRWEVGVAMSPDESFHQVSFVNGIYTSKGGKHVEYVVNQIAKKMCEWIDKRKKIKVKPTYVRDNLSVFVLSVIENPSFDSQTKETLTSTTSKFGSKCEITDKFIDRLAKSGIVDRIIELHEFKESKTLKKTDGRKTSSIRGIPKLDDANWAGTAKSDQCTLILTEGDSAKSMAVAGLSVVGRDRYGVFPLRGKLINVREKTETAKGREQVLNNAEINNLKKILGLQSDREYKSVSDLRYGKVMVMTDQDVDGSHIKGLLFNVFASLWPTLLEVPGFMISMLTPIVKVTKGATTHSFYSLSEYEDWKSSNDTKGWTIKYYKGLGTSNTKEAKEYFQSLKTLQYNWNDESPEAMDLAFNKHKADDRKDWLRQYEREKIIDSTLTETSYDDFVDFDLRHFSIYDVERSIPNLIDGLKTSQRKILFSCFKRNLVREIRVAQLSGYVSENAAYHHGEESLNQAIIGMAQDYVGSNNINLLQPNGQFGTRLQGGKDSASPRYIHTCLSPWTNSVYSRDDIPILNYLDDDGTPVEPTYYAPVIPMVLVNGCQGIGTGFSTTVPCFNPLDVTGLIQAKIDKQQSVYEEKIGNLTPWYRGFRGKIVPLNDSRKQYLTFGVYRLVNFKTIEIDELPIGLWTEDYKEYLETLLFDAKPPSKAKSKTKTGGGKGEAAGAGPSMKQYLRSIENHSTESRISFRLEFRPEVLRRLLKSGRDKEGVSLLERELRLTSKISLTNIHLFNSSRIIQKYDTVKDIVDEFYTTRLDLYRQRKEYQLRRLQYDLDLLSEKIRFINGVVDETIVIHRQSRAQIDATLESQKFRKFPSGRFNLEQWFKQQEEDYTPDDNSDEVPITADYNYLVSMPIYNLTSDKITELEKQLGERQSELDRLKGLTLEQIWSVELDEFKNVYNRTMDAWTKENEKEYTAQLTTKGKAKTRKPRKVIKKK